MAAPINGRSKLHFFFFSVREELNVLKGGQVASWQRTRVSYWSQSCAPPFHSSSTQQWTFTALLLAPLPSKIIQIFVSFNDITHVSSECRARDESNVPLSPEVKEKKQYTLLQKRVPDRFERRRLEFAVLIREDVFYQTSLRLPSRTEKHLSEKINIWLIKIIANWVARMCGGPWRMMVKIRRKKNRSPQKELP